MNLIIDDCRELGCDVIARTPQAGKDVLYNMSNLFNSFGKSLIECLYIDHDLGCKENGYDIIKWAIAHNCLPNKIQIVSFVNSVGKQNIINVLIADGYHTFDNINFTKD